MHFPIVSDLVNGGWDELKTVMEGDALSLHTGAQQNKDNIETIWFFKSGSLTTRIAHMNNGKVFTHYEKKLADRLQLDQESGSLTIRNISTSDSGVYEVSVTIRLHVSERKIKVDVYGKLQPVNNALILSAEWQVPVQSQEKRYKCCHWGGTFSKDTLCTLFIPKVVYKFLYIFVPFENLPTPQ